MYVCMEVHVLMRDAEGRKKEASKVKQTTRQSNTVHPKQSFLSCLHVHSAIWLFILMKVLPALMNINTYNTANTQVRTPVYICIQNIQRFSSGLMFLHVYIIMVVHVHSAIWLFILMKKISKIQFWSNVLTCRYNNGGTCTFSHLVVYIDEKDFKDSVLV